MEKQRLPAHFTIKAPFERDEIDDIEKVTLEFTSLNCKEDIKIKGFNHFRDNVIFMDIIPSKEALDLVYKYIDVLKSVPNLEWKDNEKGEKKLHLTVAVKRIRDKYKEIWEYVNHYSPDFNTYFDNISILYWVNGGWKVYKEYLFE